MNRFALIMILTVLMVLVPGSFGCAPEVVEPLPTKPLGDLEIGDRVVDQTWEWDHKPGDNYTHTGVIQPITWIVVGKNHYEGIGDHITLLSEELVARMAFDNSKSRGSDRGNNHWGESGSPDATDGVRAFINSLDKDYYSYEGDGFYGVLPEPFRNAIITTPLENREYKDGEPYTTEDNVFLLSQTELGAGSEFTHEIGTTLPYFADDNPEIRIGYFDGKSDWYMTRSPNSGLSYRVRLINSRGEPDTYYHANYPNFAVRPALNMDTSTQVTESPNEEGTYEFVWTAK